MARSIKKDKQVKALHAGKRKSESGNVYYESRPNRSDKNRTKKFKKGGQTKAGIKQDKNIKALHAGKRESADGNIYYEYRKNRSDKNRKLKFSNGGSLQSMTTPQLAKKAGMTMDEVHQFNYDRNDLIALITDGNFKKGGQTKAGIKQDKQIKALHAGKRTSENGNTYYESRPNRSDENRTKKLEEGGGTEKSHEDLVNEKLDSNGEISYSDFKSIIGREPCYPVCHVGGSKYRKQFLRGCYRKMGGNY